MKLALYGYGGHAREVASQLNEQIDFYVDDEFVSGVAKPLSSFDPSTHRIMIAVGDSELRNNISKRLPSDTKFFSFIHPTALLFDNQITIGEGSFIGPYCILTTNINIGKHCLLNRANHIGHDTTIGNFFSAMPGAIISGSVKIADNVFIGTNTSIKEKISITSNCKIGMNSCVVKNIDISGTYVGSPTKKIK